MRLVECLLRVCVLASGFKHGYVTHAPVTRESTVAEAFAARTEMLDTFETACLTAAGHEPQTRR